MRKILFALALLFGTVSLSGQQVVWKIGEKDGSAKEFALAPDGYKDFVQNDFGFEDRYFLVGYSNPGTDLPYVLPGPNDRWAGSSGGAGKRTQEVNILFGLEKGAADNVIEKKVRDGKTYFVVNDYGKLRGLFAQLLAEIQRIKSEGDYAAGKHLIETYAVHIDPTLHKEVKERYDALELKPYGGFINPEIRPVEKDGKVVDYEIVYSDDYIGQMLAYGRKYGTL